MPNPSDLTLRVIAYPSVPYASDCFARRCPHLGIDVEVMALILETVGMTLHYVEVENRYEMYKALDEGRADITGLMVDPEGWGVQFKNYTTTRCSTMVDHPVYVYLQDHVTLPNQYALMKIFHFQNIYRFFAVCYTAWFASQYLSSVERVKAWHKVLYVFTVVFWLVTGVILSTASNFLAIAFNSPLARRDSITSYKHAIKLIHTGEYTLLYSVQSESLYRLALENLTKNARQIYVGHPSAHHVIASLESFKKSGQEAIYLDFFSRVPFYSVIGNKQLRIVEDKGFRRQYSYLVNRNTLSNEAIAVIDYTFCSKSIDIMYQAIAKKYSYRESNDFRLGRDSKKNPKNQGHFAKLTLMKILEVPTMQLVGCSLGLLVFLNEKYLFGRDGIWQLVEFIGHRLGKREKQ